MNSAELLPQVYAELRRLAAAKLAGERQGHTLDATALVHERRPCRASYGWSRKKNAAIGRARQSPLPRNRNVG
jgi:hypothetical protein